MADIVQTIKFKRGKKADLEAKLGVGSIADGEPIFETDTGKLKIGMSGFSYSALPYVGGDNSNFVIQDPEDSQVLLYDSTTQKWVNKDLADAESIIYLAARGLTIKGYDTATQGQMLVKDVTNGLAWVNPITTTELTQAVNAANTAATQSGTYATQAGNSAGEAAISAGNATLINQKTMEFVNNKFWWGTADEYNALESVSKDTFYFIKSDD